jgi:hypothetical protein
MKYYGIVIKITRPHLRFTKVALAIIYERLVRFRLVAQKY